MGDTGMADQSMGAAARHCPVVEENTKGASLVSQCTIEITVNAVPVPSAAASYSLRGRRRGTPALWSYTCCKVEQTLELQQWGVVKLSGPF